MNNSDRLIQILNCINIEEENLLKIMTENKDLIGDYENWTPKDIVAHISEWRFIASKKLKSIKRNHYVSFHENLDTINRTNYDKHKYDTIEDIKLFSKSSCEALKKGIEVFDNSELQEQGKLSGFNAPLWRYIIIDSFLHPVAHIIFYYLKIQDFSKAFKILESNYLLITELDNCEAIMQDYFYFGDLLENIINNSILLDNLKGFYMSNKNNQVISDEILKRFMIVNNI
jgi:hypothetical protein